MENPVCVDVCPTHALELVELDEIEKLLQEKRGGIGEEITAKKMDGLYLLHLGK